MALLPLETVPGRHDFTFGTGRRVALCCVEFTEQQLRMCKWSPLWSLPHREKAAHEAGSAGGKLTPALHKGQITKAFLMATLGLVSSGN